MKVLTVVGARPQFIKAAPVSRVIRRHAEEILVHTGQHYDQSMSDVFFDELHIPVPEYHLHVGSKSHGRQTGEMLGKIEEVLLSEKPDCVLVYGDTNSTLAGALAAAKLHIPVAHVEAGLRSFNKRMPEEVNRVLTDHVSKWLFCPTKTAVNHLKTEGITEGVHLIGDVMLDAVLYNRRLAEEKAGALEKLGLEPGSYILITLHRAENTDDPKRLHEIVKAINELPVPAVLPLHPRTRGKLKEYGFAIQNDRVQCIEPVGYLDMLQLEVNAKKILTDSGGVQKEAMFARVPCITMRDETEWTETVELGANRLVGADSRKILEAVEQFEVDFDQVEPVFGDGHAAEKILEQLGKDIG
ncbi:MULTISPECIES: non-hydrolyzing UDP-N-acetylglucosamine 2-epimerase [Thermoactinomyces]|jgi:UDP-GlcNAc3NAcA epimerase|uniref:UDP-N-acetylglucosamine 2-epimerase (Non-hydrolyzing) n=1 Tax=Thermoactinomyces vulgaris TaxID=2026 RepID=A0ABS0QFY0_THEVU|nr:MULTISPECIES: UDP-N-acetylglucosamine 2-epimerase (non-hydrolyzing) [Thermoactinomyces]KFZ39566.1 UDP-N-acetylglucosamine 2-epimerase [Thermoactinomyces sp. Gus2-1]KYQ86238.1 UDP-N-acetyl glucosamine 2-epimerase [Thermoactinomyces sp. AS95]MBA4551002.1 UDP-N-acetylglucosamine 2-epimerase (non-hydrolyzing) [Thermoactinomyces vulgaris]MBA4597039.1 UDP-N-acetylglucosamine 2-epimerase (non-hydrolyzing) [Thermoactinomyces vulgaris]MBH8583546.1 UDP-N-acetylglucosamine 2-epimerase (non-hydrolyzing